MQPEAFPSLHLKEDWAWDHGLASHKHHATLNSGIPFGVTRMGMKVFAAMVGCRWSHKPAIPTSLRRDLGCDPEFGPKSRRILDFMGVMGIG